MITHGDVFSIELSAGIGIFQFFGRNKLMGSLIRVLPGIHLKLPESVCSLTQEKTNFWVFFPVAENLKKKTICKIANCSIPSHSESMPIFRAGIVDPDSKRVENWWLWDGEKSWCIGKLTKEQTYLPIRGNWNHALLKKRIEDGWLPELDKK